MKKHFLIFAFLCGMLSFFYAEVDVIRVSKIRVYSDEGEFVWTTDGIEQIDESVLDPIVNVKTILTFLSIKPGFFGSEKEILKRCEDSERRLNDSGYFYESSVMMIPPRKILKERTLVVIVSSGYFMRYGGGNAWGMYGKVGISGERQEIYAYAGYNKSGIKYLYSHFEGSPLSLGANLFYYGPGDYYGKLDTEEISNRFSAAVLLEWAFTPDLTVGIEPGIEGVGFSSKGYFSLQPFVSKKEYLSVGSDSEYGFDLRGFWYPVIVAAKTELTGYLRLGTFVQSTLAVKGSIGNAPLRLAAPVAFDLYYTEDRSVRSGYLRDELQFSNFSFASAELRYDFYAYKIPPMFDVSAQAFIFTDVANNMDAGLDLEVLDAYGLGLRVLFKNPVFAYFTFSYGVNHKGDGRFLFCGTAGY